ncbi:MAG TPA: NAD(P)-dependent oxidoreductase [Chthoniobacteraceae bacterium]|jgi:nucleoside-diphosphate-sugar epimerase|nr:NAD(P)-dependent oxidoreductase [Chthoniobacteraceae bacterium]
MNAAITGASGYVGGAIAQGFRAHGWQVTELGRRSERRFELGGDPPPDWAGIDALVHCAWDFKLTRREEIERVNVRGSIRLLEAARAAGVTRGVLISSLSCFEGCRSMYGQGKLVVEREALKLGFAVVRPGLVYGDRAGGMMGSLEKAVKLPVVPLIGNGSQPQYPVHEADLAELVFALCQRPAPAAPVSAAHGEAIPFRELLRRAAARRGRRPLFLPVPWPLILAGLKGMEALGLNPPFRSDSLTGFVFQNPDPDFSLAHQITAFRAFP